MLSTASPQRKLDGYLAELRGRLHTLPEAQVTDIVEEIRSHVLDSAASGGTLNVAAIDASLYRLGPPSALAASYITDNLLAQAERNRMPWTILRAVFHWATLSVKGFLVLLVCLPGYLFGASFFVAALMKPFNAKTGLWMQNEDSFSLVLGLTRSMAHGHELLGWTLIPIGLALGGGTILLTTHFAQWSIRRFRESRALHRSGR